MLKLKRLKFTTWLGIISIIGFLAILLKTLFNIDITNISNSFLFIIMGIALFFVGGANFFVYFRDGKLTPSEINRIVTMLIGIASIITGGLMLNEMIMFECITFINTMKVFISLIAISVIGIEIYNSERK